MNASEEDISKARRAIDHRCDGPLDLFVLCARATEYARNTGQHRAAADALTELLEEYDFVNTRAEPVPSLERG